jgi:hypothetical protein
MIADTDTVPLICAARNSIAGLPDGHARQYVLDLG